MTDVLIDARRGAGSSLEILYGTVTWKPTLTHSRGTSIVLPAPTTFDLVDGQVVATNVQPTPAPVEGQVEWAYEVTFKDRHSKTYSFLVGVPDSTSQVNFTSLPRYFETKPPLFGAGPQGIPGESATIEIGSVSSGETPEVSNSGTNTDAVLDFVLPKGDKGDKGEGVPSGGTALQYIRKDSAGTTTEWATLDKSSVGLGNVDNTSDANKPLSTPQKSYVDSLTTLQYKSKKATDSASTYPYGVTVGLFAVSDGWPPLVGGSNFYTVIKTEIPRSYTVATQWAYPYKNNENLLLNDSPIMYRQGFGELGWGTWQTLITSNNQSFVTPEQFGAKGDGVTDDSEALIAAIEAANGKQIVLDSTKTYKVTKTITNNGNDVNISGGKILADRQGFTVMSLSPTGTGTIKTLTSGQTTTGTEWQLSDTVGVFPGQIAVVKSSTPWYYDPRTSTTDARKSEVHKVREVNGNKVLMCDPANDGYDILSETVEVSFYDPIKVNITNLTLEAPLPPYGENVPTSTGIALLHAVDATLSGINIAGTSYTGLFIRGCYNTKVLGGTFQNCNYVSTGYGIQTYGSMKTLIQGVTFSGCRRGVDFSGSNIISNHSTVDNCINLGGGRESTGKYYGWGPGGQVGIQNYGFGSHGTADNSTYSNNKTAMCHMPYSLRGRNENVINNLHVGRTRNGFIAAITGANLNAVGNTVAPLYWGKTAGTFDGGATLVNRRCDYFVVFQDSYSFSTTTTINIRNNNAELGDAFALFRAGAVPKGPTVFISNSCELLSPSGTSLTFLKHEGALEGGLYRWAILSNYYYRQGGSNTLKLTENLNLNGAKILEFTVSGATT